MQKVEIVTIRISKETKDLNNDNGKIYRKGHHIMAYPEIAKPYIDTGVAEQINGNPLFNKLKSKEK